MKEIKSTALAPYERVSSSQSVWKIGDKPSVNVEYLKTNFDRIDITQMFHSIARIFESDNVSRYISNIEITSKVFESPSEKSTVLGVTIKVEESDDLIYEKRHKE